MSGSTYTVFGAGSVGTVLAGLLAGAGVDVRLAGRGAVAGLRLEGDEETVVARVPVVEILRPGATAWQTLGSLKVPRTDPVAVEWNGRVVVLGGSASDGARSDAAFTLSVEPTGVVEMATSL